MPYMLFPRQNSGLGSCCSSCAYGGPCSSGLGDDEIEEDINDTQIEQDSAGVDPLANLAQSMGPDLLEDPVKAGITGAVAGATVGSVAGPIGTLIGALIGGGTGAGAGFILGKKAKTKRKRAQRQINAIAVAEQNRLAKEKAKEQVKIRSLAQKRRAVLALEQSGEIKASFLSSRNESAADLLAELKDIREQTAEADSETLDTLRQQVIEIIYTLDQIARNPGGLSGLSDTSPITRDTSLSLGAWLDTVRQKNRLAAGLPAGRTRNLGQDKLMTAKANAVGDMLKVVGLAIVGYGIYQATKD